jgi:hypothetical protein
MVYCFNNMESLICNPKQDVVAHACNPGTGRLRQEDHEFKASLSCITKLSQKNKNLKVGWAVLGLLT